MCGITFVNNFENCQSFISDENLYHRGPDNTQNLIVDNNHFIFNRLKINDLSEKGNQPFEINDCVLICNGEIYNHKELRKELCKEDLFKSNSDCEVIIHLYKKYGFENMLHNLDGVFTFVLYDKLEKTTYIARDRIGVRPLFYTFKFGDYFACSSEVKGLSKFTTHKQQLQGGHYIKLTNSLESFHFEKQMYYSFDNISQKYNINNDDFGEITSTIRHKLESAIIKRLDCDRDIACFLSGGVDSSIVCAVVSNYLKQKGKKLTTYSIGFEGSTDLKYAKQVADYLQTEHIEYKMTCDMDTIIPTLNKLIKSIETFDVTTVRASYGMYTLSEYIKYNSDHTVILSGEGSDEVFGGYLYFHDAPDSLIFDKECKRLVKNLPYYDVLRADRCTAAHSLELRVPFLDYSFVNEVFSINPEFRQPQKGFEKYILRKAFEDYLPENIIWRRKEGFSDGVGGKKSWFGIIQEYAEQFISDDEFEQLNKECNIKLLSKEAALYFKIYKLHYKDFKCIREYWMPRWQQNCNDPSGRQTNAWDEDN